MIVQLTKREVIGRYRGSVMGLLWSFLFPLLMLGVYTFVFSVVFQSRWGTVGGGKSDFAVIVFIGMIIHGFFAECLNKSTGLVLNNANFVKRVVFPLEILVWVSVLASLFHAVVSVLVLLLFIVATHGAIPWTALTFPLLLLPLIFCSAGLSWMLASLGVFLRDVGQVIGVLTNVLLFLSPVFFPVSAVPMEFQRIMLANPLTFVIEQSRQVLIFGHMPDMMGAVIYLAVSLVVAWLGYCWFQKTRNGFGDVL